MRILSLVNCELRCRLRTDPLQLPLALSLLAAGALAVAMLLVIDSVARTHVPSLGLGGSFTPSSQLASAIAAHKGSSLFTALGLLFVGIAAATAPLAGCATVNRERDVDSFEQLLQTGTGSFTILAAKLISAIVRSLLIVFSSTPLVAIAWYYEGSSVSSIILGAMVTAAVATFGAGLGILMSAITRSNVSALVGSYLVLALGTVLGPAIVAVHWIQATASQWAALLYSSPPVVLAANHKDLWPALNAQAPYVLRDVLGLPSSEWLGLPATHALAITVAVIYILAAIVLLMIASMVMDPLHPARRWRIIRGAEQ